MHHPPDEEADGRESEREDVGRAELDREKPDDRSKQDGVQGRDAIEPPARRTLANRLRKCDAMRVSGTPGPDATVRRTAFTS